MPPTKTQVWASFKDGIPLRAYNLDEDLVRHEICFIYNLHNNQEAQFLSLNKLNFPEPLPLLNITEAKLLAALISHFPLLMPKHFSEKMTLNPLSPAPKLAAAAQNQPPLIISVSKSVSPPSEQMTSAVPLLPPPPILTSPPPTCTVLEYVSSALNYFREIFGNYLRNLGITLTIRDKQLHLSNIGNSGNVYNFQNQLALCLIRYLYSFSFETIDVSNVQMPPFLTSQQQKLTRGEFFEICYTSTSTPRTLNEVETISDFTLFLYALKDFCNHRITIHPKLTVDTLFELLPVFKSTICNKLVSFLEAVDAFYSPMFIPVAKYNTRQRLFSEINQALIPSLTNPSLSPPFGLKSNTITLKSYAHPPIHILEKTASNAVKAFKAFRLSTSVILPWVYLDVLKVSTTSYPGKRFSSTPFWIKDFYPAFSLDAFLIFCKTQPSLARQWAINTNFLRLGQSVTPKPALIGNLLIYSKLELSRVQHTFNLKPEVIPPSQRHVWRDVTGEDFSTTIGLNPELIFNSSHTAILLYELMSSLRFYLCEVQNHSKFFRTNFNSNLFNLLTYYILVHSTPDISKDSLICKIKTEKADLEENIDYNTFDQGEPSGKDHRMFPNEPLFVWMILDSLKKEIDETAIMNFLSDVPTAMLSEENLKKLVTFRSYLRPMGWALYNRYFKKPKDKLLPPNPFADFLRPLLSGVSNASIEEMDGFKEFMITNK